MIPVPNRSAYSPPRSLRLDLWRLKKNPQAMRKNVQGQISKMRTLSSPTVTQYRMTVYIAVEAISSTSLTDISIVSSSDDDFGPALPSAAPKKKRRKLPYEKLYVSALPVSPRYSKSLMHKDQLSFVTITPFTDFLITSSADGVVKFWKKVAVGIESVKEFRAHIGEVKNVNVSQDGRSFATAGADKTIKIFDVITFGTICAIFAKIEC